MEFGIAVVPLFPVRLDPSTHSVQKFVVKGSLSDAGFGDPARRHVMPGGSARRHVTSGDATVTTIGEVVHRHAGERVGVGHSTAIASPDAVGALVAVMVI